MSIGDYREYWELENGIINVPSSPPFQKGGTQIMKISKRGGTWKKFVVGNPKGGTIFKMKEGNPTFQVEFRDKKGGKWLTEQK